MLRTNLAATLLAFSLLCSSNATAASEELPGDIVTALLPLAVYGITRKKDDDKGRSQWLRSTGVSLVANSLLRLGFNQTSLGERPNGSPYGFPSGHTGFVVSNAAFLQDRYGWKYGVPAYVASAYVAWVRVDTDHHRWRDIAAAAALSAGISKLLVTPMGNAKITPVIGPDSIGMSWQHSF